MNTIYDRVYKLNVLFAVAPEWDLKQKRIKRSFKDYVISAAFLLSMHSFIIYFNYMIFNLDHPTTVAFLYSLVLLNMMIMYTIILINRFSKYWQKMQLFATKSGFCYKTNSRIFWNFMYVHLYYVVSYGSEVYIWLSSDILRQVYIYHFPNLVVVYMNLLTSCLMYNFLIIIEKEFSCISRELSSYNFSAHQTKTLNFIFSIKKRYIHALKASEYFNKLFGLIILFQIFWSCAFLVSGADFLVFKHTNEVEPSPLESVSIVFGSCTTLVCRFYFKKANVLWTLSVLDKFNYNRISVSICCGKG